MDRAHNDILAKTLDFYYCGSESTTDSHTFEGYSAGQKKVCTLYN